MDQSSEIQNSMESPGSKSSTSAVTSPGSCNTTMPTRLSMSRKAGLIMPVMKIHRKLQQARIARRIQKGSGVYCAAVLEYLLSEVFELSGQVAKHSKRKRIMPRHLLLAIKSDQEMNKLLADVIISEGGVVPLIHAVLLKDLRKKPNRSSGKPLDKTVNVAEPTEEAVVETSRLSTLDSTGANAA